MTETLLGLVPEWGAVLVALVNFLACLAIPIPASLVMLAAGAFAAAGDLGVLPLWLAALAGACLGDQSGYWLGRSFGPRLIDRLQRRRRTAALVDRAVTWLEQQRLPAIFLSRWAVSALCPYVNFSAGAARINWAGFTLPAVAGTSVWVSIYIGLGHAFSADIRELASVLGNLAAAIGFAVVAVILGSILWRNAQERDWDTLPIRRRPPICCTMAALIIPTLIAIGYALMMYRFSVWRTHKMLDQQSRPLTDPSITRLADRMARALDIPAIPVHVFEVEPVNGLASPDGRIFLTRGFLNRKVRGEVTAEELAAVIAHEMGHVALGHTRRRMIDFTGQNAVFVVLSAVLNRFLPFIGFWIANLISAALAARLSQRDEYEADAYATALLIKSGIGTAPQKSLFRKLDAMTRANRGDMPAWLLSHPSSTDRIAQIEANERRWLQPARLPS